MSINAEMLAEKAKDIRIDIIREIHAASSGHPGGSLSAADIITYLYFAEMNIDPKDPDIRAARFQSPISSPIFTLRK